MDANLIKLLPYTKPYKKHIIFNVIFNVLYALFSTISMVTMFPLLEVLFKTGKEVTIKPEYTGIANVVDFGKDFFFVFYLRNN